MNIVQVNNEIGQIKRVLVHRPGPETQRFPHGEFALAFPLRPTSSGFNLEQAQAEHDALTTALRESGATVIELRDLLGETLAESPHVRRELIDRFLANCRIEGTELAEAATQYLEGAPDDDQFIARLFEGIRYGDTALAETTRYPLAALTHSAFDPDTFLSGPLNTAFFMRDPLSAIGAGVSLNRMYWHDRNREVDILQTIIECHPAFTDTPRWFDHGSSFHLEGGDVINLGETVLAVGLSSRTESLALDRLCQNLLWGDPRSTVTDIYVFEVPQSGNRLHLDAYLSPIDHDTFVVDPALIHGARVYHWRRGRKRGSVRIQERTEPLSRILSDAVGGGPVRLLDFGKGGAGRMEFEYGNGAAGILSLAPGNLCVCAENLTANEALSNAGMTLHPVSIQEMTAGFGGPNSLCLPLERESL